MYFVALVLTLGLPQPILPPAHQEWQCLCQSIVSSLKQHMESMSPCFVRAVVLSLKRSQMRLRVTIGEQAILNKTPASLRALLALSSLHTKRQIYQVESMNLADPSWSAIATWNDLTQERSYPVLRFSLATPLVVIGQEEGQQRNANPFPRPVLLFSRLLRHWNLLGGPTLPQDIEWLIEASGCMLSSYHLHTVVVREGSHEALGYRGWMELTCRVREAPAIASLNALARLAFFTGLGASLEQGMGETAVKFLM